MVLVSRVRAATGSTTDQTSDVNVIAFVQSGVQFAISGIPKELQWHFASSGTNITSSAGQRPASDTMLSVTRNGLECIEIPAMLAYAQEAAYSPTSLNAMTALFPGYYKRSGLVYIKPDPSASAIGVITSVAIPTIIGATDDTDSDWYYKALDSAIINYACGLDCNGVGSYWRQQGETLVAERSLTNVVDALTKAQNYMDNNSPVDFESYMAAAVQDDQQAQLMIQGAAQEINRAGRELEKIQVNSGDVTKYYEAAQLSNARADKFFEIAMLELGLYVKNNSRMINLEAQVSAKGGGISLR